MRAKLSSVSVAILGSAILGAAVLAATGTGHAAPALPQAAQAAEGAPAGAQPGYSSIYCSGFVRDSKVSDEIRVISGEEASYKIIFEQGNYVYVNQGSNKGFKVGDRLMVVRPETDPAKSEWFKGQRGLMSAMGTLYRDVGQLRIVNVQPKVSIAEVTFSCAYAQRGDIVRPFEERPIPPYKEAGPFDVFAPVSGKPVGMLVGSVDFGQALGQWNTAYVNLGAAQGVKIGDYLRIFRHEGKVTENVPVTKGYHYEVYGFGSAPERYSWEDLPREVIGEGIVLNASRNSSTLLITYLRDQSFVGDEVEVE